MEAPKFLLSGDATGSRSAFSPGIIAVAISSSLSVLGIADTVYGAGKYSADTPTLMILILISLSLRVFMHALVFPQTEAIRADGLRRRVLFYILADG